MANRSRSSPSRVDLAPLASALASAEARRQKTKGAGPRRHALDYKEDIIDGFSIVSFTTAKELESFVSSQRSAAEFHRPTLGSFDDGGSIVGGGVSIYCALSEASELPSTFSNDEIGRLPPPPPPTTTTETTTGIGRSSPDRKPVPAVESHTRETKSYSSAASSVTGDTSQSLPASSSFIPPYSRPSNNHRATPSTDASDLARSVVDQASSRAGMLSPPSACLPGAPFGSASADAPVTTGSSVRSVDYLSPEVTFVNSRRTRNGDGARTGEATGTELPPPSKKMLLAGRNTQTSSGYRLETAKSLKTARSSDEFDDSERCSEIPDGLPNDGRCRGSPKRSLCDALDAQKASRFQLRGGIHSERSRISPHTESLSNAEHAEVKLSPSLTNCDLKNQEFKKNDVRNQCCSDSTSKSICSDISIESQISGFSRHHDQKPSQSSSSRAATSRKFECNKSDACVVRSSSCAIDLDAAPSTKTSNCHVSSSQRGGASRNVSSSLPERESVIVTERSGNRRPASNSNVKRECRSPWFGPACAPTVSQTSELRAAVSAGLPHSSSSVNSFPLFPLFDKESSVAGHPVYFPTAHQAFASHFSTPSLPFGLPPFQQHRSGMFAPSLGFPPSSPLINLSSHFYPETMLSLSATPGQEMLMRLQQELNVRFLQDRGLLPIAPFTLHAEMHQHQHLHHHQHLLPGSYLPPPSLAADALSFGKLPSGGGLLQSSQNLSDYIDRDHLIKSSGFGSFSGFDPLAMSSGLHAPLPSFGSGLRGAFQPQILKSGLSSLNFAPASHLLLSLRDRDPFSPATNQLPQVVKKRGKWCAAHVKTAWKICKRKRHLADEDNNLRNLKLYSHDSHHSLPVSSGDNRLQHNGDSMRPNSLVESVLPPFGRQLNFSGYDGLDSPFTRKLANDTALNPSVLRPSEWNGLAPGPPLHRPPASSLPIPGSWLKSSVKNSREISGSLDRLSDHKEKLSISSQKPDNRMIGRELHKSSDVLRCNSRPSSNSNPVNGDHRRSPSGLDHKGNGHFRSRSRSRSRSPLKFFADRSSASLDGLNKEPRDDGILWKPNIRTDYLPKFRSHDPKGKNPSGLSVEHIGYSNTCKATDPGQYQSDFLRPPGTRDLVSTDVLVHDRLVKDPAIFAEFDRNRHIIQPPLRATDFYTADIYKPFVGRLFSHHSTIPSGGLPPSLVGSSCSPPSPISTAKNSRMQNGWSSSMTPSAGLAEIPSDNGLILR